jgi:hypothetical protein
LITIAILFHVTSLSNMPTYERGVCVMKMACNDTTFLLTSYTSVCLWLYSPLLGHGRFFSFLFSYAVDMTPWIVDQPIVRPLLEHRTSQTQNKRTQTFVTQMGFELTIPAFERAKKVYALERAVNLIGDFINNTY